MRQRSIRFKLLVCFGLILTGSAVLIAVSASTIRGLQSSIDKRLGPAMKNLDRADQIATKMADMRASLRGLITFTLMKRADSADAARKAFTSAVQTIETLSTQLEQDASSDADRVSIGKMRDGVHQWNELFGQALRLCAEDKAVEADAFGNDKVKPVIVAMQAAADAYVASQREQAAAAMADAATDARSGFWIMAVLGLCVIAVGAIAVFVVNGVANRLHRIADVVASGSEQVEQASKEIENSSQALAEGSTEQAATIEETSAAFHEINSLSRGNAEASRTAATVAADSAEKHTAAERVLEDMVSSMKKIQDSSRKVATVLKVVDDIAFQTNILALNAAVEAARAGEAGLGFAVVADEVRNLAQKCAQAARETTALIEESVSMSVAGGGKADQVGKAIEGLINDAGQIKMLIAQVQTASEEQASGTDQISTSIHSIQEVTQRIAAQAEEAAAASKHLRGQSEHLNAAVEELAVMANGSGNGSHSTQHRGRSSAGPAFIGLALLLGCGTLRAQTPGDPEKAEFGFEERVRTENWNNAQDYSSKADDEREQIRYRTRVWARVPLGSRIVVSAGLTQENTQKFGKVNQLDEVVFDTANIEFRDVFTKGLSFKVGRQTLMRGEGFLLMDGTSGDGSRTTYFNGVNIGYERRKSRLDLVGFVDPAKDRFLPVWNDKNKFMQDWDERAAGFYYTDQNLKKTRFEAYYFYKKETHDPRARSNPQFQDDRHVSTLGGRVVQQITPSLSATVEFARQWGAQHPNRAISAWGGYGYLRHTFNHPKKPYIQAGYWALSGDDPSTGAVENWDPLFSRWPKWSELYVYSQIKEYGVAYWSNTGLWQAEFGIKPIPRIQSRITYYHMSSFHTFPGAASYFGKGLLRGNMLQAHTEFKVNDQWKCHALWESMNPGDFYSTRNSGYFVRFEVAYQFKFSVPMSRMK